MENQLSITLKNNNLFQDIDFDKFNLENIKGQLSTLAEGEILYREGAPADKIYLIVSGEVNLLKKSNIGKTKSFIFSENEYFGHDELLDSIDRVSTIVALRDTYLISLSNEEINGLIEQDESLKTKLISTQIEELHNSPAPETTSLNTELDNAFNSDIANSENDTVDEEVIDERIDEAIDKMHFDEDHNKETAENVSDDTQDQDDANSFSQLHTEIEQLPNEELPQNEVETKIEIDSDSSSDEEDFSLDNLDESSITEDIPDNIFETQIPSESTTEEIKKEENSNKPLIDGLVETPLNKEIENFESPDEYEDETDDVEFTVSKSEPSEVDDVIDKDELSFLSDDSDEDSEDTFDLPTEEQVKEDTPREETNLDDVDEASQIENAPVDDIYMGGISSEDELKKIDELINSESESPTEEEAEETTSENNADEFPSEFNIVDEEKSEETPDSDDNEIDPFLGLGLEDSTEEKTYIEDTVQFDDTISFDEPEVPIVTEAVEEPDQDESEDIEFDKEELPTEDETIEIEQDEPEAEITESDSDVILDPIPVSPVTPEPLQDEEIEEAPPIPEATESAAFNLESDEPNLSANQLRMIIKASEMVNSDLKLDDLLDNIVSVAASLTAADRGTLYIVENEKDELWSKVATGNEVKEYHLKIGEGIAGWVAQSGEIVNIKDAQQDERFNSDYDKASGYTTKSMLCFPIKNKEGIIIGVIQLLNSKNNGFSQLDEEMLNAVSIQIALALEKAALLEQLLQGERVSSLGKMANFLIQDIKKPILVSKRYADHLREKDLQPDIKQVLEMMTDQLNHVADIVQTTSSYSQGNVVLRTVETKIDTLLDDFINRIDSYIRTKNCQIVKEFETDAQVKIDAKEFYQCFNHVIKNACDAMPDGGNIKLSTILENGQVILSFIDNGLGIPDGLKDKVFEPFMSHGKREGTGLGLSITKKVVEHHGGTVELESDMGTGTTIIIKLPVASDY